MYTDDEFLSQVKFALDHLYEYRKLAEHPLAVLYTPDGSAEVPFRAERFNRLMLESLDAINPPESPSEDVLRVRAYRLLVHRYVEEWPLPEIMRELGLSRTQFFREQRKAVAVLASVLREKLPGDALVGVEPAEEAPEDTLSEEAQRVMGQWEPVDLAATIQGALNILSNLAEQRGVNLAYKPETALPTLYGSRTLLRQVFITGLSALISSSGMAAITVRVLPRNNILHVEMVGARDLEQSQPISCQPILEPVQELVEIAGGTWEGVRKSPTSCTCAFSLPLREQPVVLVIDDNKGIIRVVHAFLDRRGYRVVGATTVEEALRLLHEMAPAAITLDIILPNHLGWEVLQTLKRDPATREIPVVVCSVLTDPEVAYSLGADAYIHKPITAEGLLATLHQLLP